MKINVIEREQRKCEEIFILMKLSKMTLTEINTLSDMERCFLSKWFMDYAKDEQKNMKKLIKHERIFNK